MGQLDRRQSKQANQVPQQAGTDWQAKRAASKQRTLDQYTQLQKKKHRETKERKPHLFFFCTFSQMWWWWWWRLSQGPWVSASSSLPVQPACCRACLQSLLPFPLPVADHVSTSPFQPGIADPTAWRVGGGSGNSSSERVSERVSAWGPCVTAS